MKDKNYKSEEFVKATYTSVWEDGTEITTPCELDLINLKVYAIKNSKDDSDHGCLVNEYVEYRNDLGIKFKYTDLVYEYKGD